jgi:hypothetical protein
MNRVGEFRGKEERKGVHGGLELYNRAFEEWYGV